MELNFSGLYIGIASFLIIGIFHPLVIKGYWYFGMKCRWLFLLLGVIFLALSLTAGNTTVSILLGVSAFSSFWGIKEIYEQRRRVERGWFPDNPNRTKQKETQTT